MAEPEELDALAGEYVLGVLPTDEQAAVERRIAREPDLAERVAAWELRLTPLARWLPPVAPPPQVWWAITRSLATPRARQGRNWLGGLALWRTWAVAASVAALALGGLLYMRVLEEGPRLVAVLVDEEAKPALLVSTRPDQQLRLRPVAGPPPEGRSRELWLLPPQASPISLGIIDPAGAVRTLPAEQAELLQPGSVVAVSLEPAGGSPTGAPTGPVVYQGVLLRDH